MDPKEVEKISKINNYIFLGAGAHAQKLTQPFLDLQIDIVINCAQEIRYPNDYLLPIHSFPLESGQDASILEFIDDFEETLTKLLIEKKKVYIHCDYGISRAPALLIYYLMHNECPTYDAAFDLIKEIRPIIELSDNFKLELDIIDSLSAFD